MDLKIASARATDVERAAVDARARPGASGRARRCRDAADHFLARGGAAMRELRHLLLPTLHAVNDRVGWISRGAINYIAERLDVAPAEIYGVATFYALFSLDERPARQVHVCIDLACRAAGGLDRARPARRAPTRRRASALCERAPAALVDRGRRAATPRAVRAGDTGRGAAGSPMARGRTPRRP